MIKASMYLIISYSDRFAKQDKVFRIDKNIGSQSTITFAKI